MSMTGRYLCEETKLYIAEALVYLVDSERAEELAEKLGKPLSTIENYIKIAYFCNSMEEIGALPDEMFPMYSDLEKLSLLTPHITERAKAKIEFALDTLKKEQEIIREINATQNNEDIVKYIEYDTTKKKKWNLGYTIALITAIITLIGVIVALLAWLLPRNTTMPPIDIPNAVEALPYTEEDSTYIDQNLTEDLTTPMAGEPATPLPSEITFGVTFTYGYFTITFLDMVEWLQDGYEGWNEGVLVMRIPMTITNNGAETTNLWNTNFTQFGTQGLELDWVHNDRSIETQMRPGATLNAYMYMRYDGSGDYFIVLDRWDIEGSVEIRLPISHQR